MCHSSFWNGDTRYNGFEACHLPSEFIGVHSGKVDLSLSKTWLCAFASLLTITTALSAMEITQRGAMVTDSEVDVSLLRLVWDVKV